MSRNLRNVFIGIAMLCLAIAIFCNSGNAQNDNEVSLRNVLTDVWNAGTDQILDQTKYNNGTKTLKYGDYEVSLNLTAYAEEAKAAGEKGANDAWKSVEVDNGKVNFNTTEFVDRALGNNTSDQLKEFMALVNNNQTHEEIKEIVTPMFVKNNQTVDVSSTPVAQDNQPATKARMPVRRT